MLKAYLFCSRHFRIVESGILISALAVLISLTVTQILLRNFFSTSISWAEPLNQHLVLVIAFVGAMIAGRKSEHISFDVIQHYLPEKLAKIFLFIGSILSAVICFYLAYICGEMTYLDYLDPIPAFGAVSQWVFELFIPVGFFVIGYRLVKTAILVTR